LPAAAEIGGYRVTVSPALPVAIGPVVISLPRALFFLQNAHPAVDPASPGWRGGNNARKGNRDGPVVAELTGRG